MNKDLEYWLVLIGMVIYAASRDAEADATAPRNWRVVLRRYAKVISSAFLAVGLAPTLAPRFWDSEIVATVFVMGFGVILLDGVTAVAMDRDFIKEQIGKRLGGGNGNNA